MAEWLERPRNSAQNWVMRFQYKGLQPDGRLVTGLIDATSERSALRDLSKRGVQPTGIQIAALGEQAARSRTRRRALRRQDYAALLKQLQALIGGGVPVGEAVAALAEVAGNPVLSEAYRNLNSGLRRGDPFPDALAACFPGMPRHIQRLVAAGDLSGRLAEAMADAAAELEYEIKTRNELRQALVYPAFLVVFGVCAVVFMFLVVVPRFAAMLQGNLEKLPILSFAVIATGVWFRAHVLLALSGFAAAVLMAGYVLWRPESRDRALGLLFRVPFLRRWLVDIEIARWSGLLARLLQSRVPLEQSLELARSILRQRGLRDRLTRVERDVRAGIDLAAALENSTILSTPALTLIRVGERSGKLADMVRSVCTLYDEAVRNRTRLVLSIIEPVAIVLIGAVIGLIATAIFMAITSINRIPGL